MGEGDKALVQWTLQSFR